MILSSVFDGGSRKFSVEKGQLPKKGEKNEEG